MGIFIIPLTAIIALTIGAGIPLIGAQRESASETR